MRGIPWTITPCGAAGPAERSEAGPAAPHARRLGDARPRWARSNDSVPTASFRMSRCFYVVRRFGCASSSSRGLLAGEEAFGVERLAGPRPHVVEGQPEPAHDRHQRPPGLLAVAVLLAQVP